MSFVAQYGSVRDRLRILRRVCRAETWRLAPHCFAPTPHSKEADMCEVRRVEDYDSAVARLGGLVGRSPGAVRPIDHLLLARLIAANQTSSGAIGLSDLLFLHAFITTLAPARMVELGTLGGFSAAVIASAAAAQLATATGTLVETIDINEHFLTDRTKPVGFEIPYLVPELAARIRVHAGKDAQYLDQIAAKGELSVVFIDADHQHPRPTLDLIRVAPFLKPGGWVVLHDIELGRVMAQMRAAGVEPDYQPSYGAQWLFDAWPFAKISGGNIGAVQMPLRPRDLVPCALAMLRVPTELKGISAERTSRVFLKETARLFEEQ